MPGFKLSYFKASKKKITGKMSLWISKAYICVYLSICTGKYYCIHSYLYSPECLSVYNISYIINIIEYFGSVLTDIEEECHKGGTMIFKMGTILECL